MGPLLVATQSRPVNVKGKMLLMKVTTSRNSPPPGIRFSFVMCRPTLSEKIDGFQLLVDLELLKHSIDSKLMRGVESRMLQCTRIQPLKEIRAAGDNVLLVTAQGILLVVVHNTDDVVRTFKLPIVLVPDLQRDLFSSSAATQKCVKTIIEKSD